MDMLLGALGSVGSVLGSALSGIASLIGGAITGDVGTLGLGSIFSTAMAPLGPALIAALVAAAAYAIANPGKVRDFMEDDAVREGGSHVHQQATRVTGGRMSDSRRKVNARLSKTLQQESNENMADWFGRGSMSEEQEEELEIVDCK